MINFKTLVTTVLTTLVMTVNAQTSRILFQENFGVPPTSLTKPTDNSAVRKVFPLMGTDYNTFIFADPNASNLKSDNSWPEAKNIDNNFYAVVGPKYIYTSINYTPSYKIWTKLESKGDATTGQNSNGGALIINAGTTFANIVVGNSILTSGKYYKLTYKLFVENGTVKINHRVISPSGNTTVALKESPSFSNGFNNWQEQTYWFYLASNSCYQQNFSFAIQSANAADTGNDFAIDDILVEEYDALPSSVNINTATQIQCNIAEPTANDDESLENTKGNSVTLNIFNNDLLSDNKMKPTFANSSFKPLVPIGSSIGIRYYDAAPYVITVPNEGTWTINVDSGNYGNTTFAPLTSFTGNPTPIYYRVTDNSSNGSSNAGKVSITYKGNLVANSDEVNGTKGKAVSIDVLTNDQNSTGTQINKSNVKSITLINPYTLQQTSGPLTIEGEGVWSVDSTNKQLIFTPDSNFTGTATSIEYYFTDNSGNKSNKEKVYVTIDENSIPENSCTEEVNGSTFSMNYPNGSKPKGTIVSHTFNMPAADYGFQFDIYELDNSFNLQINGTKLAENEIQFQGTQGLVQNIRFKSDGAKWGDGTVPAIYTLYSNKTSVSTTKATNASSTPIIRVIIDGDGNIKIYGKRTSTSIILEELEIFNNTFNTISWYSDKQNEIIATQLVDRTTIMDGYGSGLKVVPCTCTKEPNTEIADSFTNIGVSTKAKKLNNWPTTIPNGFIALESSQKGFVITRVTSSSKITEPKPGMVIYDKTDLCVKLYNGTSWNCIKKTCNN
ncbi:Ig-like domain-containing protein [Chishuiella sp.]|uniref:Ig-like domain-containing protein n=1 Tax=Chishuiella sp. TaxID=1969467 RepID=UPI0028B01C2B|nr:hypothetical protein [Chishuiella sp.]